MDLVVRLIRSNNVDDVIRVRRRANGGFTLRYVDGTLPHTVWINEKSNHEVMAYLESTLYFFRNDADPFGKIQVEVPGYPTMFAKHSECCEHFCDQLMLTVDNWVYTPAACFRQ